MGANFEYPITLQEPWLLKAVTSVYQPRQYLGNIVQKHFIRDAKTQRQCSKSSIIRIFQFIKVTRDGGLTAIVSDTTHKMGVKFSYQCIRLFERRYKQRITFKTVNCLFLIKTGHLRFLTRFETGECDGFDLVIEVEECEVFCRDQLSFDARVDQQLRMIYHEPEFLEQQKKDKFSEEKVNDMISDEYDDMISI